MSYQGPSEGMKYMYGKDPQAELANILQDMLRLFLEIGGGAPYFQQCSYSILGLLASSAWVLKVLDLNTRNTGPSLTKLC